MKKISVILLLTIFLFNTAGYYIVFFAEQMQIKNEVRAQINAGFMDQTLTSIITIKKSEINKITFYDDEQEIQYNDLMYDVAKTVEAGDVITYYCINDYKETSLIANLDDHINTHILADKPLKSNGSKKITDNILKIYFPAKNVFDFNQIASLVYFPSANTVCLLAKKQKSTPPPPEFC